MKQKILNDIKEISKIKVTNFKEIENEEFITNMVLLACAEYIDKYNCGFMPFKLSLLGLQNMITCCINFLDDDNINLFTTLDRMLKLSDKENLFSRYYEEIEEELEEIDELTWHLIFSKTFIKIKLYRDIVEPNKKLS